ncbi:glycosyl hydrolase [Membranihabitans maritimus]|uniref:glycosyl hydrolase n=1 Tax=Membranihabitans maritimus TaxID=2904244 RepID=UPI001F201610|nr:glycosyl hydrolase [Membranihabitans maritimus]
MWNKNQHALISIVLLLFCLPIISSTQSQNQSNPWPEITKTHKPWSRWWWMGNAVDRTNIRSLLEEYHSKGVGGLEIAPIYGAKGYEDRYITYLSPEWRKMLEYTVQVADSLGIGIDLTQGTGWPFGGPWVSREDAASKMVIREYTLSANQEIEGPVIPEDPQQRNTKLQAMIAQSSQGQTIDLTNKIDNNQEMNWTPDKGEWNIIALFSGKTGQKVKRAAPGGAGFTLDHYSPEAVDNYLEVYDSAFSGKLPGIRALYNDSYEVYGANWTNDFLENFQEKKGYDLKTFLPQLLSVKKTDEIIRIKSDYREVLNSLLLENFTQNWTNWVHDRGKVTKNQAHGSPGNLLDIYGTVDIPECETFGSTYFPIPGLRRDSADIRNVDPDPIMLKFASSAAHVTGKNLTSCETFTWLGEHFKSSFSQMKPELEQTFLAGVNHMFYHGITYSPLDAPWPGWLFYASLNLSSANSLWPHFPAFNHFVSRCQSVLQSGKADNELLVYWPIYDVWADSGELLNMITVHHIDEWLHPTSFYRQSKKLMDTGYSLDFISDLQIAQSKSGRQGITTAEGTIPRKALIIPECDFMPVETLQNILSLAENGATVIFESKPRDVPGIKDLERRRNEIEKTWSQLDFINGPSSSMASAKWGKGEIILTPEISLALDSRNIKRETLTDTGLEFIRRKGEHSTYYFIANHTAGTIDSKVTLNNRSEAVIAMDPVSGHSGLLESQVSGESTTVRLYLKPGKYLFLKLTGEVPDRQARWEHPITGKEQIEIKGPWNLTFKNGGPDLPQTREIDSLISWHQLDDPIAPYFSGQAVYQTQFNISDPGNYLLDLGTVRESARVWINSEEVGYAWSIPYELPAGKYLKKGKNTLKIEVANLMANRIRYLDDQEITWRNYHEINFVNIDYKPFDASVWDPIPSGLLGPVRLVKIKK